eukprot:13634311-Ditylum_brightwellii.AAC.1
MRKAGAGVGATGAGTGVIAVRGTLDRTLKTEVDGTIMDLAMSDIVRGYRLSRCGLGPTLRKLPGLRNWL